MENIGVIFDLDGTLLDTLEDLKDSVNYVLKMHNYKERTLEEIRNFVGRGIRVLMEKALPKDIASEEFEICLSEFVKYYETNKQVKTRPYPGIMEVLKVLRDKNIKIGVVSNKFQSAVEALNAYYFQDYIPVAIGNQQGLKTKPAPDSVYLAAKQLGLAIGHDKIYFVGDSEVDIMTAHNANIPIISVLWGFRTKAELLPHHPDFFASTPQDILNLLNIQ